MKIDKGKLPRHIAIVMDGNGRWAQRRGLPRHAGHRAGVMAVDDVVTTARKLQYFMFNTVRAVDRGSGLVPGKKSAS